MCTIWYTVLDIWICTVGYKKFPYFHWSKLPLGGWGILGGGAGVGEIKIIPRTNTRGAAVAPQGVQPPLHPPKKSLSVLKEYRHLCYTIWSPFFKGPCSRWQSPLFLGGPWSLIWLDTTGFGAAKWLLIGLLTPAIWRIQGVKYKATA